MKKAFAILLAMGILLSSISCTKGETTPEIPDTTDGSTKEEKIQHNLSLTFENETLPQLWMPKTGDSILTIETSLGDMHFILFPDYAPNAVKNFTTLGEDGFYKDALFSQAVENFYIQSGAPKGTDPKSIFQVEGASVGFQNEVTPQLWHFRGALAMRNNPDTPDSNTSEFFIVQAKTIDKEVMGEMKDTGYPEEILDVYKDKGGIPGYDMRYTVFGQLYAGEDVLDAIGQGKVDENNIPEKDVLIKNIVVGVYDEENPFPETSGKLFRGSEKAENANKAKSTYEEPKEPQVKIELDDIENIQDEEEKEADQAETDVA